MIQIYLNSINIFFSFTECPSTGKCPSIITVSWPSPSTLFHRDRWDNPVFVKYRGWSLRTDRSVERHSAIRAANYAPDSHILKDAGIWRLNFGSSTGLEGCCRGRMAKKEKKTGGTTADGRGLLPSRVRVPPETAYTRNFNVSWFPYARRVPSFAPPRLSTALRPPESHIYFFLFSFSSAPSFFLSDPRRCRPGHPRHTFAHPSVSSFLRSPSSFRCLLNYLLSIDSSIEVFIFIITFLVEIRVLINSSLFSLYLFSTTLLYRCSPNRQYY